ncbi:uncharacterized protein RHIMIDRAFT_254550 [Rhizopus microsporus ATCC 52813]|uniref:Uncharacterized protein n=1 Tax=Rhizopus microsporus ATCC 52813 TaxID=1340429 RepID=A0A2G4T9I6_RHIZD|nr:uncharacterized protein RHIMIDRAFT_254550 [Rhizopus microsporus ATCC 52813]PHZ17665.1 hypothetical protein RHIMIDRAFT_254550 [Rhizopus microsporus ATCC 52813]
MLKKSELTVHLIDEFTTSSECPNCKDDLETFKTIINHRPYKRVDMSTVKCQGLSRYMIVVNVTIEFVMTIATELLGVKTPNVLSKNLKENCGIGILNFRKILVSLKKTNKRSKIFTRKQETKPVYI